MGAPPPAKPTPLRNSYWVIPGKVLAGEHPGGASREATREKLQRLINAGVECFIDLTEPNELKAYDRELPFSIEYLRKPIKDHSTPAQRVHMAEILDCMHDALQSGRCVYVHCRAGIGRTGTVIGCFLVERGLPGESALDELNRLWQQCERSQSWASIPETHEQTEYVAGWKRRGIFDDRGGLTTSNLRSSDDDDDLRPGASPAPWAHLLGNGQSKSSAPQPAPKAVRSPAAATPAHRSAVADAARAAARESNGEELLIDPTSVSKLPQGQVPKANAQEPSLSTPDARTSRQGVPGWIGAGSAPVAPAGSRSPAGGSPPKSGTTTSSGAPTTKSRGSRSGVPHGTSPTAEAPAGGSAPKSGDAVPAPPSNSGAFKATAEADTEADPLLDPEALAAASNLRGRFLGALIGLATGDAVAAATQYRRPGSFAPVGDMLGGGPFDLPRGAWSDDTAMALCLADSLLERNGFDARDQMERYRRWQQQGYLSATGQCVGITANTARAIAMAQWRRQALFGSHDPSQQDPEPLSRVAAAVLFFFATSGEAINQATEAARTTCQAPAVLDSCRALARALYAALTGQPKAIVLERAALSVTPAGSATGTAPAAGGTASGSAPVIAQRVGSSAPAALAAAVAAFGATDNFRDAILYAVNLGGDSDVVAAVCGQLAGAYYTVKAIPTSWYNGLMQKELISGYADRLLAHAMVGLSG
jgi:ADP-ribosyl-[dinitrogen reductase] hydrolase